MHRMACPWFFKVSRRSSMAQEVCESSPLRMAANYAQSLNVTRTLNRGGEPSRTWKVRQGRGEAQAWQPSRPLVVLRLSIFRQQIKFGKEKENSPIESRFRSSTFRPSPDTPTMASAYLSIPSKTRISSAYAIFSSRGTSRGCRRIAANCTASR